MALPLVVMGGRGSMLNRLRHCAWIYLFSKYLLKLFGTSDYPRCLDNDSPTWKNVLVLKNREISEQDRDLQQSRSGNVKNLCVHGKQR